MSYLKHKREHAEFGGSRFFCAYNTYSYWMLTVNLTIYYNVLD